MLCRASLGSTGRVESTGHVVTIKIDFFVITRPTDQGSQSCRAPTLTPHM